jgi:hypothetical protein
MIISVSFKKTNTLVKTAPSYYLTVLSKISFATALASSWKFNIQQLFPRRNSHNPVHNFYQDPIKISTKEIRIISFRTLDSIITIGSTFKDQLMTYPRCVKNSFIRSEKYFSRSQLYIDVSNILPLPCPGGAYEK